MVWIGHLDLDKGPGIVAVIGSDPMTNGIRAKNLGADILEVRTDMLGLTDPGDLAGLVQRLKAHTGLPIIVTNRCSKEGGQWKGSEASRMDVLVSAVPFADGVDVELSAPLRARVIQAVTSARKTLIISSHDFSATPSYRDMQSTLKLARAAGADIAKLAVTPVSSTDTLRLLTVTHDMDFPVCTIAMGKLGRHTRVVAPIYGSVLTYGAVDEAAAPGQLRIDELRHMVEVLV